MKVMPRSIAADQADALLRILLFPDVVAAQADRGNALARAAKLAIDHVWRLRTPRVGSGGCALCAHRRDRSGRSNGGRLQEVSAIHEKLQSKIIQSGGSRGRRPAGAGE
jgi:hypothetical protein